MKCEECPISLACWSGNLCRPQLCPLCGNFFTQDMPLEKCEKTAAALGFNGLHCEKRVVTPRLRGARSEKHLVFIEDPAGFMPYIRLGLCTFCRNNN